jgi:hypothetical protein
MDRTGRALGTLSPVLYFENASGHILLPPVEIGKGDSVARKLFEERYKPQGYEWREASTLNDVDRLQKRLQDQAQGELNRQTERVSNARELARQQTRSNLYQRMTSSDCDPYEKDFIRYWMMLDDDKKKVFEQRFNERNMYLHAREFDSHTPVTDRIKE